MQQRWAPKTLLLISSETDDPRVPEPLIKESRSCFACSLHLKFILLEQFHISKKFQRSVWEPWSILVLIAVLDLIRRKSFSPTPPLLFTSSRRSSSATIASWWNALEKAKKAYIATHITLTHHSWCTWSSNIKLPVGWCQPISMHLAQCDEFWIRTEIMEQASLLQLRRINPSKKSYHQTWLIFFKEKGNFSHFNSFHSMS